MKKPKDYKKLAIAILVGKDTTMLWIVFNKLIILGNRLIVFKESNGTKKHPRFMRK